MNSAITDEIIEELTSSLQRVEAQSAALLEFVKAKGLAKEDELAPYLERAGAASAVRWRATRARMEKLLSGLEKSEQQAKEHDNQSKQPQPAQQKSEKAEETDAEKRKTTEVSAERQEREMDKPERKQGQANASMAPTSTDQSSKKRPSGQTPKADKNGAGDGCKQESPKSSSHEPAHASERGD